ncbi:MAG: polyhydroxybutyrate depolymerase [Saprospiraceae bacterium]|jgi:polyhydroxybutyrate depolymerase
MKNYITLLFFTCLISASLLSQVIDDGFVWDGQQRSYRLVVPSGYVQGDALPLVLNFHGFGSNGFEQQLYSEMDQVADTGNFFVVYPHGLGAAWNVGWAFGSTSDDLGFTNALIDTISANYGINLDRVYSTGMSNGGFFSYKLACDLSDRIAKIASVTGGMVNSAVPLCMPENPIPVMQIHGTADPIVNYNGSTGVSIPVENLLANWRDLNACTSVSDTIFLEDINTTDESTAQLIQYRDCDDNVYMAFYKIINGGHTWPGASINVGVTNQDFNASSEIWNFFNDKYPVDQVQTLDTDDLIIDQRISVFPNPFQTSFTIQSSVDHIVSIKIFDAIGRLVYGSDNLNTKAFQINNTQWHKGFYFVQTKTGKTIKIIKIIKR